MSFVTLFIIFAAVIGATAMTAILGYLLVRIRQLEAGGGTDHGAYPTVERMDLLQDEIGHLQTQMSSLDERLDFTERLLMSGGDGADEELSPLDDSTG